VLFIQFFQIPKNSTLISVTDLGTAVNNENKDGIKKGPSQAISSEKRALKKLSATDLQRWHMLQRKEKKGARVMIKAEGEMGNEIIGSAWTTQAGSSTNYALCVQGVDGEDSSVEKKELVFGNISEIQAVSTTSVRKTKEKQSAKSHKTDKIEEIKGNILDKDGDVKAVSTMSKEKIIVKGRRTDVKINNVVNKRSRNRRSCAKKVIYVESSDSELSINQEPSSKFQVKKSRVQRVSGTSKMKPKNKVSAKRTMR